MVSGVSVPLVGLVDAGVAGRLEAPEALGGVALGGWLFEMLCWTFGFLRMGTTGLVAQAEGSGDQQAQVVTLARALITALVIGLTLSLGAIWLTGPSLELLAGGQGPSASSGASYLTARMWGATPAMLNYVCLGWLLGRARPRSALALQLVMNSLNMGLSLWWGPRYGVAGIGAASAAAQWLTACLGLAWVLLKTTPKLPRGALLKGLRDHAAWSSLAKLNLDLMVRTSLLLAVFGAMNSVSARLGALTLSANALLLHLQSLQAFALDGFAHGVEVLSGEAYGAGAGTRLKGAVRVGLRLTMGTAALISLCYAVGSDELFALLTRHEEVSLIARELAPWAIISPLISAPCFLLDGVMVGATQGSAMRRGMSWSALVFILSACLAVPSLGNHGLWLSLMCFMLARALTLRPQLKELYARSEGAEAPLTPRDDPC